MDKKFAFNKEENGISKNFKNDNDDKSTSIIDHNMNINHNGYKNMFTSQKNFSIQNYSILNFSVADNNISKGESNRNSSIINDINCNNMKVNEMENIIKEKFLNKVQSSKARASGLLRYSRSTLLKLRDNKLSKTQPKCISNVHLMSLCVWKLNEPNYMQEDYHSGNKISVSTSRIEKNLYEINRDEQNCPRSRDNIRGINTYVTDCHILDRNDLRGHIFQKNFNINHRNMSSSQLMPAFVKRKIIVSQLQEISKPNNHSNNNNDNNSSNTNNNNTSNNNNNINKTNYNINNKSINDECNSYDKNININKTNNINIYNTNNKKNNHILDECKDESENCKCAKEARMQKELDNKMKVSERRMGQHAFFRTLSPINSSESKQQTKKKENDIQDDLNYSLSSNIRNERRIGSGRIPFSNGRDYLSNEKLYSFGTDQQSTHDFHNKNIDPNLHQARYNNRKNCDNFIETSNDNYLQNEKCESRYFGKNNDFYDNITSGNAKSQYARHGILDSNEKYSIEKLVTSNNKYNDHNYRQSSFGHNANNRNRNFEHFSNQSKANEPEWVSCGPKSQQDTIELRGFDEYENDLKNPTNSNLKNDINQFNEGLKKKIDENLAQSNDFVNENIEFQTTITTAGSGRIRKISHSIAKEYKLESNENLHTDAKQNSDSYYIKSSDKNIQKIQKESTEPKANDHQSQNDKKKDKNINNIDFNFDAFLDVDPLCNLLNSESKPKFSRWFQVIQSESSSNSSIRDEINSKQTVKEKLSELMSSSLNSRQSLSEFLERGKFNEKSVNLQNNSALLVKYDITENGEQHKLNISNIDYNEGGRKPKAISVEELEAKMRLDGISNLSLFNMPNHEIEKQKQSKIANDGNPIQASSVVEPFNEKILRDSNVECHQSSTLNSWQSTNSWDNNFEILVDQRKPRDSEAFKRILEQLVPNLSISSEGSRNNQINHTSKGTLLQTQLTIGNDYVGNQDCHKNTNITQEEINQLLLEQNLVSQQSNSGNTHQLNQLKTSYNKKKNSSHPVVDSNEILERQGVQNMLQSSTPQRIPSPREIQIHTQNIIQNALIRRKLEEQQENFRKKQEAQPTLQQKNLASYQQQQHHKGQPGSDLSEQQRNLSQFLSTGSNIMSTSDNLNNSTSTTLKIRSPTPTLAFTPTSVLRKMTAEKDFGNCANFTETTNRSKVGPNFLFSNLQMNQNSQNIPKLNEPRMILGGQSSQNYQSLPLQRSSPGLISPQRTHIDFRNQQQKKWNSSHNEIELSLNKPFGRPILKGGSNSLINPTQQQQHQQKMNFSSNPSLQMFMTSKIEVQQQERCNPTQFPQHQQTFLNQQSKQLEQQFRHQQQHIQHIQISPVQLEPFESLSEKQQSQLKIDNFQQELQKQQNVQLQENEIEMFGLNTLQNSLSENQQRQTSSDNNEEITKKRVLNLNSIQQQHIQNLKEILLRQQRSSNLIRQKYQSQQQQRQPNPDQFVNINNSIGSNSFVQYYSQMIPCSENRQNDNFCSQVTVNNSQPFINQQKHHMNQSNKQQLIILNQKHHNQLQHQHQSHRIQQGLHYQEDGTSPTSSNQLARWFSPELLARASAGKLPSLNMSQALSLEEFERSIQHSSTAVLN